MMNFITKSLLLFAIIFLHCLSLTGCDNINDFFDSLSQNDVYTDGEVLEDSFERQRLLKIIEQQTQLIEELSYLEGSGDREEIHRIYTEILSLDQRYQVEFEQYEKNLTPKDARYISEIHSKVVKSIPRFSELF